MIYNDKKLESWLKKNKVSQYVTDINYYGQIESIAINDNCFLITNPICKIRTINGDLFIENKEFNKLNHLLLPDSINGHLFLNKTMITNFENIPDHITKNIYANKSNDINSLLELEDKNYARIFLHDDVANKFNIPNVLEKKDMDKKILMLKIEKNIMIEDIKDKKINKI